MHTCCLLMTIVVEYILFDENAIITNLYPLGYFRLHLDIRQNHESDFSWILQKIIHDNSR